MRLAYILQSSTPERPSLSLVTSEVIARLQRRGARVEPMVPADLRSVHDLADYLYERALRPHARAV